MLSLACKSVATHDDEATLLQYILVAKFCRDKVQLVYKSSEETFQVKMFRTLIVHVSEPDPGFLIQMLKPRDYKQTNKR